MPDPARFVNAMDYSIVRLTIDDEVAIGVFGLQVGANRLVVEIGGANERAVLNYTFGLDYLRLQPAD
jgi:hypothetical protein